MCGTSFEVVEEYANHNLVLLLLVHSVDTEREETRTLLLSKLQAVSGFYVPGRGTFVDQDKSIDSSVSTVMQRDSFFLDLMYIEKNMEVSVGRERAAVLSQYDRSVFSLSTATVAAIIREYGEKTARHLNRFDDSQLYRAHFALKDLVVTS